MINDSSKIITITITKQCENENRCSTVLSRVLQSDEELISILNAVTQWFSKNKIEKVQNSNSNRGCCG